MKGIFNILDNSANKNNNNFTTLQNARMDVVGELEAIIQYENHLMQTSDPKAQSTIKDIAKEEKVHTGQLFGLIFSLDPESKEMFEKGLAEFNDTNK
ncbi:MAG: hypothetical protein IJX25_01155 [Clostridia bacterium]|nr:hypothetical protein [Clostridia bacterium]MBQ8792310.1 hypothetical protein [Clostridia bacterium]